MVWFLDVLEEDVVTSLVLQFHQFLSWWETPHEIGEETVWQSSSKLHYCNRSNKTWIGRGRKFRAPGWSGSWWWPLSLVVVLAHQWGTSVVRAGGEERGWWLPRAGAAAGGRGAVWEHCEEGAEGWINACSVQAQLKKETIVGWKRPLMHKNFQFSWSPTCLFFSFVACVFGVISNKPLPNPVL